MDIMSENELKSSSVCEANVSEVTYLKNVVFVYEWKIGNFISFLDRKYEIYSPSFCPDPKVESKWKLVVFPKSSYPEGAQLAVRLMKVSDDGKSHGIKYKFCVVSKQGALDTAQLGEKVFKALHDSHEEVVISHYQLIDKGLLHDGCLVIRCEMDVLFPENDTKDTMLNAPFPRGNLNSPNFNHFPSNISLDPPNIKCAVNETKISNNLGYLCNVLEKSSPPDQDSLSSLSEDLEGLYNSKNFADIVIVSEGTHIYAHKAILSARSDYFKMLCSGKGENTNNTIRVPDIKSVFLEAVLYYLYTGKTSDLTLDSALEMMSVAKKIGLLQLQQLLGEFLKTSITVDNVTEILQLSEELSNGELKRACMKYVNSHHSSVVRSRKWQLMIRNNPRIAGEVLLTVASFQNHNALS